MAPIVFLGDWPWGTLGCAGPDSAMMAHLGGDPDSGVNSLFC